MKGVVLLTIGLLAALGTLVFEHLWYSSIAFQSWIWVVAGLILAIWLLWIRRDDLLRRSIVNDREEVKERVEGDPKAIILAGIIGVGLAFTAQLTHWPYLGWLVFLYWLGLLSYAEFGKPGAVTIRPILILLIFLNPIPTLCEPWSALALQSSSTNLTMMMLDFMRIFFYSEGNVLGLISQRKLYPELFQGVSWLFPTMFIVIAWGIYFRYSWVRTTVNVCQAIGWVIVGNATGATILLANKESGGSWIDFPTALTVLDYMKFAAILFFTWSGDQFLASTLRSTSEDTNLVQSEAVKGVDLLPLRWKLRGLQFALLIGLVAVCGLSLRLSNQYRLGIWQADAIAGRIDLPGEIDGWKVDALDAQERRGVLQSAIHVNAWSLEREGRSMVLEIAAWKAAPKPYLYPWLLSGWRLQMAPSLLDTRVGRGKSIVAQLGRLPGEVCTVIALGTDQYGSVGYANSLLEPWDELPKILQGNLLHSLGARTSDSVDEEIILAPSHTISLSEVSSKPLDSEKLDELKQAWTSVYPLIENRLLRANSR
jgi:hypothetical protein